MLTEVFVRALRLVRQIGLRSNYCSFIWPTVGDKFDSKTMEDHKRDQDVEWYVRAALFPSVLEEGDTDLDQGGESQWCTLLHASVLLQSGVPEVATSTMGK